MNIFRSYSQSPANKNTVMPHRPRNKLSPGTKAERITEEWGKFSVQERKESFLCEGETKFDICQSKYNISNRIWSCLLSMGRKTTPNCWLYHFETEQSFFSSVLRHMLAKKWDSAKCLVATALKEVFHFKARVSTCPRIHSPLSSIWTCFLSVGGTEGLFEAALHTRTSPTHSNLADKFSKRS